MTHLPGPGLPLLLELPLLGVGGQAGAVHFCQVGGQLQRVLLHQHPAVEAGVLLVPHPRVPVHRPVLRLAHAVEEQVRVETGQSLELDTAYLQGKAYEKVFLVNRRVSPDSGRGSQGSKLGCTPAA